MRNGRYPTEEEFWKRLKARAVEADLRDGLKQRTERENRPITRLAPEATVIAVAARLLPSAVPAHALAAFLDENFDKQLGRADDKLGVMPRAELIPAGFTALDEAAQAGHGRPFGELPEPEQDALLAEAEKGQLPGPDRFDSAAWFRRTRGYLLLAFGSDPRGMLQMGFPGPSYKPGHVWLDEAETEARVKRRPGYLTL
jgi:hypothetical protein